VDAEAAIRAQNEPYKLEILAGLVEPDHPVHTRAKGWWDLCRWSACGQHPASLNGKASTSRVLAGAYWRAIEKQRQLQADLRHGLGNT